MSKKRATADSWKTKSMPAARKELLIEGSLTREEYVQISQGLVPQSRDDKWFIYLQGEWLNFHRSWTGTCVFQLQIVPAGDIYRVTKAIVNRNASQYRNTDDEYDVALLSYLIDHLLLGRFAPFPMPQNLSEEDQERHKRLVMGDKGADGSIDLQPIQNGNK